MSFAFRFLVPLSVFAIAFWMVPWQLYDGLGRIPGGHSEPLHLFDDSRLNNYFLEHVWQVLRGNAPSLWNMPFFYPFPWVLGFSDNLFGSVPVYLLARALGAPADTAFQIWFHFGFATNFAAAYYALRRIGGSVPAAAIGALIFAFALPTAAHAWHVQLHYRFGIPLALVFFAEFLQRQSLRALLVSFGWLVWQFYAGIYMGFFALIFMALMVVWHGLASLISDQGDSLGNQRTRLALDWNSRTGLARAGVLLGISGLLAALVLLFYPYLQVRHIYGATRYWSEISLMLPRPQSYLLSDGSFLWSPAANRLFDTLPMRHEHQMFVGMVPLVLALAGLVVLLRAGWNRAAGVMTGAMGLLILITLYVGGASLWYLIHWIPLASAIRAMTRFDQVLLFPVGLLAMIAIDALRRRVSPGTALGLTGVIAAVAIVEMSMHRSYSAPKEHWRARMAFAEARMPATLPADAILFMSQQTGPFVTADLEAMWIALERGIPTLNGYSGMAPPDAGFFFGQDCMEHGRRLTAHEQLSGNPLDEAGWRALSERIVFVGFEHCDTEQLLQRPAITIARTPYTPEQIRHISYEITHIDHAAEQATIRITSTADSVFSAMATHDRALRVSWRFLDSGGAPITGWDDERRNLPRDIPAQGMIDMDLDLRIPSGARVLEVSMVQERVFWFFDIGVPVARADLP